MNDDKTRPRLSLKRKAPPADASVPASEAGRTSRSPGGKRWW
nr:hypothetical protein [Enterobacter cloacae complex sp.]